MKTAKFDNYDKNRKPMVKVTATGASIKQGDQNLSPLTKPVASKSGFSKKVLIKNKVTSATSAKLQAASRLIGRLGKGGAHKKLT